MPRSIITLVRITTCALFLLSAMITAHAQFRAGVQGTISDSAGALVPDEAVEAFAVAGSPEHCLRRLRDFVDAGIEEPVLSLVGTPGMCAFGIDVMRRFEVQ